MKDSEYLTEQQNNTLAMALNKLALSYAPVFS